MIVRRSLALAKYTMLFSNIYKNICRSRLLNHISTLPCLSYLANRRFVSGYGESSRSSKIKRNLVLPYKHYSSETQTDPKILLPPLSDAVPVLYPKLMYTFRNFYTINIMLGNQIDPEFDIEDFSNAAVEALYVVSKALAYENYTELEELVTSDVLNTVRESISKLDDLQKRCIHVKEGDVIGKFPYYIEVLDKEDEGRMRKFVRITMVYHYIQGFQYIQEDIKRAMAVIVKGKELVANYRFIREYTNDKDSPWTLDMVNHFSLTYIESNAFK